MAKNKREREGTNFGRRLRALREAAGLTQDELGEKAGGISYQTVARYERGAVEPTWPTVLKLAKALGVSTDAFASDADDDEPPSAPAKKPTPKGKPPRK